MIGRQRPHIVARLSGGQLEQRAGHVELMFERDSRKLFGQVSNVIGSRRPLFSTHSDTPIYWSGQVRVVRASRNVNWLTHSANPGGLRWRHRE